MNKEKFINELSNKLNYDKDKCVLINDILENNFVISKKSKDLIISELVSTLNVDNEEATHIYEVSVNLIKEQVKDKLKHPFRSQD